MTNLPDLWDEDAVVEWLNREMEESFMKLLVEQGGTRNDHEGRQTIEWAVTDVLNPYHD